MCLTGQQTHQAWTPSRIYCQEENEKQETKNADELKAASNKPGLPYTSAVPQTDHLHNTPKWGSD